MDFLSKIVLGISILSLIVSVIAIYQTKSSRTDSLKPIIVPAVENAIESIEKLFAYNYDYPIQEFEFHGIAYFFVTNIGRGPACNVKITKIDHNWKEIKFNIGQQNKSNFPEGNSIPIILRIGFTDTKFEFGAARVSLEYEDIIGKKYFLTVEAWLTNIKREDNFICHAKVINYYDKDSKDNNILPVVTFREIENSGYYELEKIDTIKTSDNIK